MIAGLESDSLAEFSFFFGDLNYRLNTCFAKLNNNNIQDSIGMIHTHDQLTIAREENHYPMYTEPAINFLPGYKLSFTETLYLDKKDQSPSFCDRVLYKNNSSL